MLHVHRAERADRLADGLAETLLEPLGDPFAPDVVAVPTRGIERWLTQRLSTRLGTTGGRRDGVCANVEFPFPGRLILGALAAATGIDPEHDPWLAERSVWPLLEVVDECLGEPWLATLARHLEGARGEPGGPDAPVRSWSATSPTCSTATGCTARTWSGHGRAAMRTTIGRPSCGGACARGSARRARPSGSPRRASGSASDPGLLDLPARLSLFGLTRIPRSYLDVLAAIAERARCAPVRAPPLARALGERRRGARSAVHRSRTGATTGPRFWRPTGCSPPGAATSASSSSCSRTPAKAATTTTSCPRPRTETLLTRIQADIREDRQPPGPPLPGEPTPGPPCRPADRTVQIHACHGRARQVEVLRDAVLHLLEDDPTLEPRDVIVMCPDIETFAPLIQATFGSGRHADDDD